MAGHPLRFWWIGVSALLVCIGSFGPWAKVLFVSVGGLDGDGVITLILGLAVLGLLAVYVRSGRRPRPWWPLALILLGGLSAGLVGAYDWSDLTNVAESDDENPLGIGVSVGWGLVMVTLAGFSVAAAAVVTFLRRGNEPATVGGSGLSTTPTVSEVVESDPPQTNAPNPQD